MRVTALAALLVMLCAGPVAWAQEQQAPPKFSSVDDIIAFLESFEGGPAELQAAYENLPAAERQLVDENFEPWSLEGGLSLMGGASYGDETEAGFRLGASVGMVWPVGEYDLPIYYAFPDIPGPWAAGWTMVAQTDNFASHSGALLFRWAYEYIGTTPMVDAGAVLRWQDDALDYGARLDVGYGNILLQGYLATEIYLDQSLAVFAGVRIPWLLATLL